MTTELKPVINTTPEELENLADIVRKLANDIENGKVIGMAWAVIKVENKYSYEWVKSRGVTDIAMSGVIHELANYMDYLRITEEVDDA